MDDKWNMTDEQLIEILRGLGNATRKKNRNYDRTIYDVAADRIERLLRSSREEAEAEIVRLRNEMRSLGERIERDLIEMRIGNAAPCELCHGLGVRPYGSTATWRGGGGGQAITSDVCDRCWGSGTADRPWPSHRDVPAFLRPQAS